MSAASSPASQGASRATAAAPPLPRHASSPLRMVVVVCLFDLATLTLAILMGFGIWRIINPLIPPLQSTVLLIPVCCVLQFAFSGQYPGIGLTAVEHMRRICHGVTLTYLLFTAAMFLARDLWADSRGTFLAAWAISLLLVPGGRWVATHAFAGLSWWGVPVVVIGASQSGRAVIRALATNQVLGYKPVACFGDTMETDCEGIPVTGGLSEVETLAGTRGPRYAVVAVPDIDPQSLLPHMRKWCLLFHRILVVPELTGVASLWTEPRDLGGIVALETRQNLLNPWNQHIKRVMDIVVAGIALLLAAPIIVICAFWIRKVSPGSAFYSQEREGREGTRLRILKLRTMHLNADQTLHQHLARDPEAHAEWERFCKLKRDPRILPGVGTFLRKTSLDELPQLWNILKGEMSLVGPRPFPEYHNVRFNPEFRQIRTQVSPGLTGLWQVSARSDGDLELQQSLDSYYIRNWSLWLDLYILARTARAVLAPKGAY